MSDDILDDEEENLEDSETAEGEEGEEGEPKKAKSKKKLILFIAMPLLLLCLTGAGLYFSGVMDSVIGKKLDCAAILEEIENEDNLHGELVEEIPEECLKSDDDHEDGDGEGDDKNSPGVFLKIPNLIVNFNSTSGRPKFLKLSIQIEVADDATKKKLEDGMPRIVDHFQTYLRELRLEDMKGSAGLYRMRIELKSRVASAIPGVEVKDVLFQEILIQQ